MRQLPPLAALLLLAIPLIAADATPATLVKAAKANIEKHKYAEAIADLDKAITIDEKYADAYRERAWAKSRLKAYTFEQAKADADRAIELAATNENYHMRALLQINIKRDYDAAIEDLTAAIKFNAKDYCHWNVRGFCKLQQKNYEGAIPDLDEAIRLKPTFANPHQHRAECLYSLGKYEEALPAYLKALELEEKPYPRMYYTTGECYYQLKKYNDARDYFRKSIDDTTDSNGMMPYTMIGHCDYVQGEFDDALKNYETVCKHTPKDANAHHCRGLAFKALGRADDAKAAFAKAKELGYTDDTERD